MICESCECEKAREEQPESYYRGVEDATRHAMDSIEAAFGYRSKTIPRPMTVVLCTLQEILDDLESRKMYRFRQDLHARLVRDDQVAEFMGHPEESNVVRAAAEQGAH